MKKVICLVLCAVLLLTFAGCAPSMEQVEIADAVEARLVEAIGKPKAEVMGAFDLTEEDHSEQWPSMYVKEFNWYGMPMETEIGFSQDMCNTISAKATLPDDENTLNLMKDCLAMLEKQFNAPYRYDQQSLSEGDGGLAMYEIPDEETFFKTLSEMTNGGVGFRYNLAGEEVGPEAPVQYVDILFSKSEKEPGQIRISTWLRDISQFAD